MLDLAEKFARKFSPIDGGTLDSRQFDLIAVPQPKPGFMGISMGDEVLMVDHASQMSFRVKAGNLGLHKQIQTFRTAETFAHTTLTQYFSENLDNPYAVTYVVGRLSLRGVSAALTQVPPVRINYISSQARGERAAQLLSTAQPMDLLFSRPLGDSPISRAIRKIDCCQFSHVGAYIGDGLTSDAGPDGITQSPLAEMLEDNHVALYRTRSVMSDVQRALGAAFLRSQTGTKYNWKGVIRLAFEKKLGMKPHAPSVSDLLFSDSLQLIGYV